MRSLEIFSGAGGMAKGLEIAGFEHAAFVEFNKQACETLRANFKGKKVFFGDVRDYDFESQGDVDVVAGGPPCQPFSLGGKHQADLDSRDMFPYAIRAIETLRPKAFIFENVKGLLRESFSEYFQYIVHRLTYPSLKSDGASDWKEHLQALRTMRYATYGGVKYRVSYQLLNAADYGVPQTRERVVIVGIRDDVALAWKFPAATHSEQRLLWEKVVTGEYWDRHKISNSQREIASAVAIEKAHQLRETYGMFEPDLLPWRTVRDTLFDLPNPIENHNIVDHLFRGGARSYPGHSGSDYDSPAKTIKAGGHGVPGGENMIRYGDGTLRYFTVFEAKRIQTFPDDYFITGAWGEAMRQIGNAVPVLLAEKLGRSLHVCLNSARTRMGSATLSETLLELAA
jgi:DNA (cytosine-5)-methyltransferase 1